MPRDIVKWRNDAIKNGIISKLHAAEVKYGIPDGVLVGQAEQESDHFNPAVLNGTKKSSAGAIGIMQFMPATAKDEGVNPLDIEDAINGGARYLRKLYDSTGSWNGALTSYNWGIGNYKKWIKKGSKKRIPKEAREYARRVYDRAKKYGSLVDNAPSTPDVRQQEAPQPAPQTQVSPALLEVGSTPPQPPENLMAGAPKNSMAETNISNDAGSFRVVAETPEESNLINELGVDAPLLQQVPELLQTRTNLRSGRLIKSRGDALDKLLGDIIDAV